MKNVLIICFLILPAVVYSQITWEPFFNLSNTPSATSDYHAVHSDGFGNYYVVWGDNGDIKFKRSSDYGATWASAIIIFSGNIGGWPVVKSNNNHVYVVCHQLAGDYEILFNHSSDNGQTWDSPQIISGMDDGSITPQLTVSGSNVIVAWERRVNNFYDIIYRRSSDNGATWSTEGNISNSLGSHSRWVQIEAADNTVYCAWLESVTYPQSDIFFSKSEDGGETWWLTPPAITNDARPQNRIFMKVKDFNNIYIASDDIITFNFDEIFLMKSSNGGATWSTPVNITNNSGHSNTPCIDFWGDFMYFTWADNSHTAPAYDNMDVFFKWSSDDGVTWRDSINLSVNSETSSRPRICSGINGPLGAPWIDLTVVWYDYSTGDAEILARRGNHFLLPTGLALLEDNSMSFILMQNYPNPFNPVTSIQYAVGILSNITLKVYDVLGNEVATLVDEYKPAGSYEVEFNGSDLSSGIYFYKLIVGEYRETKKMILVK